MRWLLVFSFAIFNLGVKAQVVNCPSGFNTNHSQACALSTNSNAEDFFLAQHPTTLLNGTAAILSPANGSHSCWALIRQTKVTNTAFTAHWQVKQNALNHTFVLENQTNQNGQAFCSGAGDEAGCFQGANGSNIQPNFVSCLKFDSYQPLTTGAFTYSSMVQVETLQSPVRPPTGGSNYIPEYQTNAISTFPVPMNNPAGTQETTTGDVYDITVNYDHGTGIETIAMFDVTAGGTCTPTNSGTCFFKTLTGVWIPEITGATSSWVGFTAGTSGGGVTSPYENDILNFTYTVNTPSIGPPAFTAWNANATTNNGVLSAASPTYSVAPGTYTTPQTIALSTSSTINSYICYVQVAGTGLPTLYPHPNNNGGCAAGLLYTTPLTVNATSTIYAMAGTDNSKFTNGGAANQPGLGPPSSLVAGTYTISAGSCGTLTGAASQGQLHNAIAACSPGQTLTLGSGVFGPFSSSELLPCGVSVWGQTVPYSKTPNQTSILIGSSSFAGPAFKTTAGCPQTQSIQYLAWDGKRPTNGGSLLFITAGTTNFNAYYNYIHGNNCNQYCGSNTANLISLLYSSSATTNDVNIEYNIFGASGDCGAAMTDTNTESGGGFCNGVGMGGYLTNINVTNNTFYNQENGMKYYEASGYGYGECNNCNFNYNDYQQFNRIGIETQANIGGPSSPTLMSISYNTFSNPLSTRELNYDISMANGCQYQANTIGQLYCVGHADYNFTDAHKSSNNVGYEIWGGQGTTANGNVFVGCCVYNLITWAKTGQFTFNNNTMWVSGNNSGQNYTGNCDTGPFSGFWNKESNPSAPVTSPSCTGTIYNAASNTQGLGTITSVAPLLPSSQTFSGTLNIPIMNVNVSSPNGSNPGRDSNTTFWCTTDGSTPVAGSGTAVPYWTGAASQTAGTITINSTTTVQCLGMWGAPNQPYSYATGYGYIPSAVVSATYTTGTAPTLVMITITSASGTSFTHGQTSQLTATGTYSDSSTQNITSTITWNSSNTAVGTVNSSGLYTAGTTINSTDVTASLSGVTSNTITFTTNNPTVVSGFLSNPGNQNTAIAGGASIQFTATVTYSDSTTGTLPDSYGNTATWSIVPGSSTCGTINSTGLFTPTTAGTCNIKVVTSPSGITLNQWTMTISNPTKTLVSIALSSASNVTSVNTGATNQLKATGTYSDSSTADITSTINTWTTSNSGVATISASGLVTGVAAGSVNFTAAQGSVTSPAFPLTIISSITLQNITISTPGNVNLMHLGWTLPFTATCTYSDSSQTNCTTTDIHGNLASWVSSNTSGATFTNNILKEIGSTFGNGYVTASTAGVTSAQFPMLYSGSIPVTFNLQGVHLTFTGTSITISY